MEVEYLVLLNRLLWLYQIRPPRVVAGGKVITYSGTRRQGAAKLFSIVIPGTR